MQSCPDCGTRMYGGLCSNCQEEAYILENQSDAIDTPVSTEFMALADEQFAQRKAREDDHAGER